MSTIPLRPGEKPEISEDEKRIIEQRLATYDEDRKTSTDARVAIASIRENLKRPVPR